MPTAPVPLSKTMASVSTISTKMTTKDTTTAPAPTAKMITEIEYQDTTVIVMAMTTAPEYLSMTTIENTVPEPSTTSETTMTEPAPSSSAGEDTINIIETGFTMKTKTVAPALSSKSANTYTNTYTVTSIGTAKETGLSLEPGGVTQDPIHSDNSSLSSGTLVSDIEIERVMQEIELIETMDNMVDNTAIHMIETTEMDMEAKTDRVMERILPIPTETIEAPIEAPTSPVNE